jgi:hypothetical protein
MDFSTVFFLFYIIHFIIQSLFPCGNYCQHATTGGWEEGGRRANNLMQISHSLPHCCCQSTNSFPTKLKQ